ncbi:MAG TPA: DUF4387 family protein [Streptosporangiaceae bacterium]|jgi:hypothetical protein
MGKLWEHARLIRSKNAGPWELTIDVICDNERDFEAIRASGIMSQEFLAQAYRLDPGQVRTFEHRAALALKASFVRPQPAGDITDTDVFGGQFHSPLVELDVIPREVNA